MQTDILTRLIQVTIMKKYGDDADSFHDQGTRVEESSKWHRQHKIGPIYPHHSQPNPNYYNRSIYKPKPSNKPTNRPKYTNKSSFKSTHYRHNSKSSNPNIVTCPKCGRKKPKRGVCSYCNYIIKCPNCGKNYNKKHKGKLVTSCPHCRGSEPIKQTYKSKHEPLEIGICRRCGHEYDSSLRQCPNCGSKYIVLNAITCNNCGYKYDKNKFDSCPKCKSSNSNASNAEPGIEIIIIFIILVVLGALLFFIKNFK